MDKLKKLLSDSAPVRWLVLVLLAMLTFSTYWFQDFFSGLKPLMQSQLGFSSSDFGLMISATTWANLAGMIIVGGIILDKWGIRISGIVFGGLATLGATVTALAASGFFGNEPSTMLHWMMFGRLLFGTGLETVCVLVSRTIVKWFKGHELALAFAINMGFGRAGSALGTAFSIDIGGGAVSPAVTFAATLIGIALIGFLVYMMFDIKIDKQVGHDHGDVLGGKGGRRHRQPEALEQVGEGLLGVDGILVAIARQTHHQAVADQLVIPGAGHHHQVAHPHAGVGGAGAGGQQEQRDKPMAKTNHGSGKAWVRRAKSCPRSC
jgi:MFS family permease